MFQDGRPHHNSRHPRDGYAYSGCFCGYCHSIRMERNAPQVLTVNVNQFVQKALTRTLPAKDLTTF